ncbi:MAG: TonB-dependent receptor, partial [Muribaculaceae bacterium]|nr:TonB-dependent receptor [Muribaculaceae bacterium]
MIRKFFSSFILCSLGTTLFALNATQIKGRVTDAQTGEPIGYATVKLIGKDKAMATDTAGVFIFDNLAPGDYSVEASFIEYTVQNKKVSLKDGESATVDFTLSPDAFMLDQVVVTGNKSEMRRRVSSTLVNVVPSKIFDLVSACSLADGLNFQPGVRVENDCQNCGFTQVRINGLDGHYSQILMNSRPVFSALTGVYGLEQIPANMIERVEVMRGGGSALFGSSAIGGTVNIITRDPIENSAEVSHTLTSMGISGALDNNTTVNASVVNSNQKIGLFIYGQNRYRDGYDHDDDGFTEIAQLKTQTLGARVFARPSDKSRLTFEYHNTHEYRRGGDQLDKPAHEAMVAEQVEHNIHGVETSYDFWNTDQSHKFNIYAATQNTKRNS